MEEFKRSVEAEVQKSLNKLKRIKSHQISELSKKYSAFSKEVQRLNKRIPELANNYIKENSLTKNEITEVKKVIARLFEGFIQKAKVPGTNPNFKIKA